MDTTPSAVQKTPKRKRTPVSVKRRLASGPRTPHTLRALKIRSNATPSQYRRKSLFKKRTPRDDLRVLSRALAKEKIDDDKRKKVARNSSEDKEDEDIVVPIDDDDYGDDDNENENENESRGEGEDGKESKTEDPEVRRRLSNRLSIAAPRLSDGFEFPTGLLSVKKNSISMPEIEEDDTVHMVPEDSFRIQVDDNKDEAADMDMDMGGGDDYDMMDMDMGADDMGNDETLPLKVPSRKQQPKRRDKPEKPTTAIPRRIIKDTLKTMATSRVTPEAFESIIHTSERFFDQITADLNDYASHAKRKKIDKADVIALMKRQRLINDKNTAFTLAHKWLPAELLELL